MITNRFEFWLMNNPVRRVMIRIEAKKLRKMCPIGDMDKVLEIGCGEGQTTKCILKYFDPGSIDAVDLDPKMIVRAKKKSSDKRIKFRIDDCAKLSFAKDNSYDAVFDFGVIHHIPNWQDCLSEIYRVLKPGGYFLLEDLSIDSFNQPFLGKLFHKTLDHPYDKMYTKLTFNKDLKRLNFKTIAESEFLILRPFWKILQKQNY